MQGPGLPLRRLDAPVTTCLHNGRHHGAHRIMGMKTFGAIPWLNSIRSRLALLLLPALLGCAGTGPQPVQTPAVAARLPLRFDAADKARWEPILLPGKLRTAFQPMDHQGRRSLQADSSASASMLRQRLQIAPEQLGRLRFEWQVANLIEGADMRERDSEDSPVRLVLAFDGDRRQFSPRNAMLNELTRALTGEEMPYAVLMYVWSNDQPVGTVITNPRTDRIRKIVVESGSARLQQWLRYDRQITDDFVRAFGEPPQTLQSIAIMTDTDNTRGQTKAWYGPISLDSADRP